MLTNRTKQVTKTTNLFLATDCVFPQEEKKGDGGSGGACYLEAGIEESGPGPNDDPGCLV